MGKLTNHGQPDFLFLSHTLLQRGFLVETVDGQIYLTNNAYVRHDLKLPLLNTRLEQANWLPIDCPLICWTCRFLKACGLAINFASPSCTFHRHVSFPLSQIKLSGKLTNFPISASCARQYAPLGMQRSSDGRTLDHHALQTIRQQTVKSAAIFSGNATCWKAISREALLQISRARLQPPPVTFILFPREEHGQAH